MCIRSNYKRMLATRYLIYGCTYNGIDWHKSGAVVYAYIYVTDSIHAVNFINLKNSVY